MQATAQHVFPCRTPGELDGVAAEILRLLGKPRVVALTGPLGAGKTTLVKALCRRLGVTGPTASPSFAILYEYGTAGGETVYHFDLYRIRSEQELYDLGYEDYFYSGNYCFVEWADRAPRLLPPGSAEIRIAVADGHRTISLIL